MKKKIAFIVDVPAWAYDDRAQNWRKLLRNEYEIDIIYLKNYYVKKKRRKKQLYREKDAKVTKLDFLSYQGIVVFYYKAAAGDSRLKTSNIPLEKTAICINNDKWEEEGSEKTYDKYLKDCRIIVCCNQRIINEFSKYNHLMLRASQAVNDKVFFVNRKEFVSDRTDHKFRVGWSGDPDKHKEIKNVDMLKDVCGTLGMYLRTSTNRTRPHLNKWYNGIDLLVCASKSEGGPLSILEAGSCGIPVISTPVGLVPEIIKDGENGFIVPHDKPEEFKKRILQLSQNPELRKKFGERLHETIINEWTYTSRIVEIKKVLKGLCNQK